MIYLLVKQLLLPPASLLWIALAGLIFPKWRRVGRALSILCLVALYLAATPFVATRLLGILEPDEALAHTATGDPAARAVVVLGAGVSLRAPEYGGPTLDAMSLERLRYGVLLARTRGLPLLVTGGPGPRVPVAVGTLMAETAAREFRFPVRWAEVEARTTFDNATRAEALLRPDGITDVLVVSHAWHMRRALWSFRQTALHALSAPTGFTRPAPADDPGSYLPSGGAFYDSGLAMHEMLGMLWYRLRH
ncbi:YdcF family protein [Oceanibacterium hippocampi]|uniref:DUF218 domain-containing protein n=1 Tax=Oceanibacterium hippocampi TaxID=745714 RepID=A0A1Y5TSI2_9PROT|nr:YdcF family protein [Oceanibacterium hippocampi]SLN69169.1 hypothetical protein OCH7691_03163 [Oceanibacterium hippocampi]